MSNMICTLPPNRNPKEEQLGAAHWKHNCWRETNHPSQFQILWVGPSLPLSPELFVFVKSLHIAGSKSPRLHPVLFPNMPCCSSCLLSNALALHHSLTPPIKKKEKERKDKKWKETPSNAQVKVVNMARISAGGGPFLSFSIRAGLGCPTTLSTDSS